MFLAGATGAVGRRAIPILVASGWRVVGLTRRRSKCPELAALGAEPVVGDVFEAAELRRLVAAAEPTVVMHQLTDLPPGLDAARMDEAVANNARIRDEGTHHLVCAAVAAGARRVVAQSVAFAYADGARPHHEGDALAVEAPGRAGLSARGVASLERQVLAGPFEGVVLRYGRLYGPGTGFDRPQGAAPVHVDAAAHAAALAAERGAGGVYNIVEDDGTVSSEKAKRDLGWMSVWRLQDGEPAQALGGREPRA